MTSPYASAIAAAAAASPMGGSVPILPSRTLLVDGDGLAYYCAGNDDTSPGDARMRLIDKIKSAQRIVGAGSVGLLLTLSGSHKGHRYAVARVKPYQGQRANSRRPKNWSYLRDIMENNKTGFDTEGTSVAEADDLFGWHSYNRPNDTVIYTQDKDMRMLPGMHLDWVSHTVHTVGHELSVCRDDYRMFNVRVHDSVSGDKQYGPKWFWLQMLHGDQADNIPGLPKVVIDGKAKLCGPVTAEKLLAGDAPIYSIVAALYESYYGKRWLVEMMEQAVLLWMRRVPEKWDDCMDSGGPLYPFNDGGPEFAEAYSEIANRVQQADVFNASTQDN